MGVVAKRSAAVAIVVAGVLLAVPTAGQALTTQTFSTSESLFAGSNRNQGWWSPTSSNSNVNTNYLAGNFAGDRYRNFFSFDLSSACRANGVTLQLTRFRQTGPLTYSLFDVSTPAATLNANNGTSQAIFDDLGSGTSFGSFPVADGEQTDVLSFSLSSAGVAAFNAARGGFFSIGGQTPGEASFGDSFLYAFSSFTFGTQQLVVTCQPTSKDQCKNGGWRNYGFKNQGQCVAFVIKTRVCKFLERFGNTPRLCPPRLPTS